MSIYNIEQEQIYSAYDYEGTEVQTAYDIDGEQVFPDEVTLKVMTYNVQHFTKLNAQQTMQDIIINGNDPDIIGFQEISKDGTIPTVGQNVLTNYTTKKLSNHINYIAMASKTSLSNYVIADYTNQDAEDMSRWNETRAYMVADLTVDGHTVKWINTHLCYLTQSVKWLQMGELLTLANGYVSNGYPVIITGDFNSFCQSVSDGDYTNQYKPFVDAGYHLANCTADAGFTNTQTNLGTATALTTNGSPTDSIIVSSDIEIVDVKFDYTKLDYLNGDPIDHIPIIAVLQFDFGNQS